MIFQLQILLIQLGVALFIPLKEPALAALPKWCFPTGYGSSLCGMDKEATQKRAAEMREENRRYEEKRQALVWALRTRVLTKKEMLMVKNLGVSVIIRSGESYREEEKEREFNDLLLQQFRFRAGLAFRGAVDRDQHRH